MKTFLLVAMLVGLPMQAQARYMDGETLVSYMRESQAVRHGQPNPHTYKAGVYDGYLIASLDAFAGAMIICPPKHVTIGQAWAVVSAFIEGNPANWKYGAEWLVRNALKKAFPCG